MKNAPYNKSVFVLGILAFAFLMMFAISDLFGNVMGLVTAISSDQFYEVERNILIGVYSVAVPFAIIVLGLGVFGIIKTVTKRNEENTMIKILAIAFSAISIDLFLTTLVSYLVLASYFAEAGIAPPDLFTGRTTPVLIVTIVGPILMILGAFIKGNLNLRKALLIIGLLAFAVIFGYNYVDSAGFTVYFFFFVIVVFFGMMPFILFNPDKIPSNAPASSAPKAEEYDAPRRRNNAEAPKEEAKPEEDPDDPFSWLNNQ